MQKEDKVCALCGGKNQVSQVGMTTFWCEKCINRGLNEAKEMNEIEKFTDEVETWINQKKIELVEATVVQRFLGIGLYKANKVLDQLVERKVVQYKKESGKYQVSCNR